MEKRKQFNIAGQHGEAFPALAEQFNSLVSKLSELSEPVKAAFAGIPELVHQSQAAFGPITEEEPKAE